MTATRTVLRLLILAGCALSPALLFAWLAVREARAPIAAHWEPDTTRAIWATCTIDSLGFPRLRHFPLRWVDR